MSANNDDPELSHYRYFLLGRRLVRIGHNQDGNPYFSEFANGETKLMLEAIDPQDEDEAIELVGRLTGISFAVADIRAAYAALSDKKVRFDGRPELQPWGGALAYFFDTDDNILTLIQYPLPD